MLLVQGAVALQQARAHLCDPSGGDCMMFPVWFMCRGFHQMLDQRLSSVRAVLSIVCSLFPLDVDPTTGRGHGRHPNVDCTFGAADRASLQVFL